MLLGKSGGQLLITPEIMKWLGQSRNDTQLWMCLVMKVKFDVVKNSMKGQKDITLEDEPNRSEGVQYAAGKEEMAITNSSKKKEAAGPKMK